jgi:hypothetical protein
MDLSQYVIFCPLHYQPILTLVQADALSGPQKEALLSLSGIMADESMFAKDDSAAADEDEDFLDGGNHSFANVHLRTAVVTG